MTEDGESECCLSSPAKIGVHVCCLWIALDTSLYDWLRLCLNPREIRRQVRGEIKIAVVVLFPSRILISVVYLQRVLPAWTF